MDYFDISTFLASEKNLYAEDVDCYLSLMCFNKKEQSKLHTPDEVLENFFMRFPRNRGREQS